MATVATRTEHLKHIARVSVALSIANFKTTYARSWLGYAWYLLNPLILFATLLFLKHTGDVFATDVAHYPLYLLVGIVFFQYFIKTTTAGLTTFQRNRNMIKNMHVPLEAFVLSHCLTFAYAHAFDFILVCIVTLLLGGNILGLIAYPFIFILLALTTFGITIVLAPLATAVSDIASIWAFVGTLLLLSTPIFYVLEPTSIMYTLNLVNPLFAHSNVARDLLLYGTLQQPLVLLTVCAYSIGLPLLGISMFTKQKKHIAERL